MLEKADHPYIVKLAYAFQTEKKLYMALEYCPGGEVFFHLQRAGRFNENVAMFYAACCILAIEYLHFNGVIYRDLKPQNLAESKIEKTFSWFVSLMSLELIACRDILMEDTIALMVFI